MKTTTRNRTRQRPERAARNGSTPEPLPTAPVSADRFLEAFTILDKSAVGVILCHTREPARTEQVIRNYAFAKVIRTTNAGGEPVEVPCQFRSWDCRDGWTIHTPTDDAKHPPAGDRMVEATEALYAINDVGGDGTNKWPNGIFVMHYVHWAMKDAPQLTMCLKKYAVAFSATKQRLILIVPEGTQLPIELQNDIPVLDMDLPDQAELRACYDETIGDLIAEGAEPPYGEGEVDQIVSLLAGMTYMEATAALTKSVATHRAVWPEVPLAKFVKVIAETKIEVVKRSASLELLPPISPEDVGGLENFKDWMEVRRTAFTPQAAEFGVVPPKGAMVIGPPGGGKTLLGKMTASILDWPFVRMDMSKLLGSYIGESEKALAGDLKLIKALSPVVVLVDEIDKQGMGQAAQGMSGDSGVGSRQLSGMLTFMQETTEPIFWIFSANRISGLPPELLRKGRLDEVFSVLQPNESERMEILRIHLRKRKQNADKIKDLRIAVDASDGYVGAEIEACVNEAVTEAFSVGEPVTGKSIVKHLGNTKPISVAFKADFDAMSAWAKNNARPASLPKGEVARVVTQGRTRNRNVDLS